MTIRRYKCIVFDLDDTLWLQSKSTEYNTERAAGLSKRLREIKADYNLFLGVASFNTEANDVTDTLYDGLFDVVACGLPNRWYDKTDVLQNIRKAYAATHSSQKLKWDEMIFYDDSDDVLVTLRSRCPKLTLCGVNGRVGITMRTLDRLIDLMMAKPKAPLDGQI